MKKVVLKASDQSMPRWAFNVLTQTTDLDFLWTFVYKNRRKECWEMYVDRYGVHEDLAQHVHVNSRGDIHFTFESCEDFNDFKQKWATRHPEGARCLSSYMKLL